MTTECWICESCAILQIGSFRHLRRFLACYCLLPSYFGAWTPRLLREPNSATRWFGFLHFITSGGSSSGSGSEEPLVRWFAIPVRARRESSNTYLPRIFVDVPVIKICSGGYLAVHCSVCVSMGKKAVSGSHQLLCRLCFHPVNVEYNAWAPMLTWLRRCGG